MIIEEKNLKENKLTDEQVEQVAGGRYRGKSAVHDIHEDETKKPNSTRSFAILRKPH